MHIVNLISVQDSISGVNTKLTVLRTFYKTHLTKNEVRVSSLGEMESAIHIILYLQSHTHPRTHTHEDNPTSGKTIDLPKLISKGKVPYFHIVFK